MIFAPFFNQSMTFILFYSNTKKWVFQHKNLIKFKKIIVKVGKNVNNRILKKFHLILQRNYTILIHSIFIFYIIKLNIRREDKNAQFPYRY